MINKNKIIEAVRQFKNQKIIVIGDVILDQYFKCRVDRISPEAPVIVAVFQSVNNVLGGAANTAHNIASLAGKSFLLGMTGDDNEGKTVKELLDNCKINNCLITDREHQTIVKSRIVNGNHQLLRIDKEKIKDLTKINEEKLISILKKNIKDVSYMIVSDYAKGLITESFSLQLLKLANLNNIKMCIDSKPHNYMKFCGAYLIKTNRKEIELFLHTKINTDYGNLPEIAKTLKRKINCSVVVITLGKDGVVLLDENDNYERFSSYAKEVYDVSGAGDTVLAGLALGLSSGLPIKEAVQLSNVCAGMVVGKFGTAVVDNNELIKELLRARSSR